MTPTPTSAPGPAPAPVTVVPTSVVTLNAGRDDHLVRLAAGVGRCDPAPCELVVVAMGDAPQPREAVARHAGAVPVRWVDVRLAPSGALPLAAARNAGAAAAVGTYLVFLDVDCIPGPDLVGAYTDALARPGVVSGPVRWLERFWDHDLDEPPGEALLRARSAPHPVRPVPAAALDDERHELLWTLAVGIGAEALAAIGGFDEGYVGYGGEDTDLGLRARAGGLPMRWLPTGTAYHQWHRVSDPPVEHLDAIVVNARRFHERWGRWPMDGWLAAFAADGLVAWDPAGTDLRVVDGAPPAPPTTVVSIPATHPYTRRVLPDAVVCAPDPTRPWWPHPALEPAWVDAHVAPGTVVHLHFGFEHRTVADMDEWCRALRRAGAALVVTVHDVDNPHCDDRTQADHHRRLGVVLEAADAVLTLTGAAAVEVRERWGRDAVVVPHPAIATIERQAPAVRPARRSRPVVGVDLKALRAGAIDPVAVVAGLGRAASLVGADARAWIEAGVDPARRAEVAEAAAAHGVVLTVEAPPDDVGLAARFAGLDVAVLPYRTGTHSGLLELCRDVGTRPVVPTTGCYLDQWGEAVGFTPAGHDGGADPLDAVAGPLAAAVVEAVGRGPVAADPPGWRADQLDAVRRAHLDVYRAVTALVAS